MEVLIRAYGPYLVLAAVLFAAIYHRFFWVRATREQMEALELAIANSKDASLRGKQAIIWLLRQSRNLRRPVCVSFSGEHKPLGREVGDSVHGMVSSGGTTHLSILFGAITRRRSLSDHGGCYIDGKFDTRGDGWTIWVARRYYDDGAVLLEPDIDAIDSIKMPDWFSRRSYIHGRHLFRKLRVYSWKTRWQQWIAGIRA